MDQIDITSAEYTISDTISDIVGDITDNIIDGGEELPDFSLYIYIGILILVFIISILLYKFYSDRNKHVTFQDKLDDCYGDVCNREL